MLDHEWNAIEKYIGELWPKSEMTPTELGLLRRTIEKRDMRDMTGRNYADCLDAERIKSKTHKPSIDALVDRFALMNSSNAMLKNAGAATRRNLRVDMYRRDMGGGAGLSDAAVLARHCHTLERGGLGTNAAMEHMADCLAEMGMLRGEVLDEVAHAFGPAGEHYRDDMLAKWEERRTSAKAARDQHTAARVGR